MKKTLLIIICVVCIIGMNSCSDVYEEILLTDINKYSEFLVLPERLATELSELFPGDIDDADVQNFVCLHKTLLPVGTEWQVELTVRYNSEEFSNEKSRIRRLCAGSPVFESSEHFKMEAYASVWNWNGCYEYVLVDSEHFSIIYIYLQLAFDNAVIDENYMPIDYSVESAGIEYTIY